MPNYLFSIHANDGSDEWFGGVFLEADSANAAMELLHGQELPCDREWKIGPRYWRWAWEIPQSFKNAFVQKWVWNALVCEQPEPVWEPGCNLFEDAALKYIYQVTMWSNMPSVLPFPLLANKVILASSLPLSCDCH